MTLNSEDCNTPPNIGRKENLDNGLNIINNVCLNICKSKGLKMVTEGYGN